MNQQVKPDKIKINLTLNQEYTHDLLKLLKDSGDSSLTNYIFKQLTNQHFFELTDENPNMMTYRSFTLEKIEEDFAVQISWKYLFENITPIQASDWLKETLSPIPATPSEKARSEAIIYPILREIWKKNIDKFSFLSGKTFKVDESLGLSGECDFILNYVPHSKIIQAPVFTLVKAKHGNIEEGWGQCAAQMIAAQKFNQNKNQSISHIFGCVTNGEIWNFLQLENDMILIDERKYYENELQQILGILQFIIDFFQSNPK